MLTRGHLIGQIIDDLAGIAGASKLRASVHLFDIHTHIENFAEEVLNRVLHLNLTNLNAERSNNPGLDLGDVTSKWAFQVTANKSGAKVKETLEKIDDEQKAKYSNIRVLVIGEKQGSYSTFNEEPFLTFGFTPEMVWDFNDICSHIMSLSIDDIVDLANYVTRETRRVRIELEIPNEDGQFPTNIDDLIEALPQPKSSDAAKMHAYFLQKTGDDYDRAKLEECLKNLSTRLAKLPRQTREVFKFLVERRDDWTAPMTDTFTFSDQKLRRIYRGDDLNGDLALLLDAGFLSFENSGFHREVDYWIIHFPGSEYSFHLTFIDYVNELHIDLRIPLVVLDFSGF